MLTAEFSFEYEKSRTRETLNLSTNADSSTITIIFFRFFFFFQSIGPLGGGGWGGREGRREGGTLPLLTHPVSTVGWLTVGWLRKPEKVEKCEKKIKTKKKLKLCHRSPILAICPSTRSLHDLWKRVFRDGTNTQTDMATL